MSSNLSEEDIQKIADALITRVKAQHHEFWIDPEQHYQQHMTLTTLNSVFDADMIAALKSMATAYKKGNKIFWRIFLTLVSAGVISMAFQGWISDKFK